MKKQTLNKTKAGNVIVYMHFVNGADEITDTVEIARFKSMSWADNFVAGIRAEEESHEIGKYVGYKYEIVEVK